MSQQAQQLENHLQYLTRDKKAAIAIAAFYDATKPAGIDFDYICIIRRWVVYRLPASLNFLYKFLKPF